MNCFNKKCVSFNEQNKDNCTIRDQTKLCSLFEPFIEKKDDGSKVPCSGELSDAERDMDMIFCLAIAKTFTFGSSEAINLLEEYRSLMKNKEEMLKKIKGR